MTLIRPVIRLWRSRAGAAAVESAFVLPVALLLLLGVMELGRAFWTQSALTYAVQQGARCASVQPTRCGDAGQIAAYASGQVVGLSIPPSAFTAVKLACGWQVSGALQYKFLAYAAFPSAPVISARICRP
jgi:Flp pilus assembly protein TadG